MTETAQTNFDGWANCQTGSRPNRDHMMPFVPLSPMQLEAMFAGDWLSRKICERPAKDATRKGILINESNAEELHEELERLQVFRKTRAAISWSRLFGGAALILLVDDGKDPREPLDTNDVDSLVDVMVVDRNELSGEELDLDVESTRYMLPNVYRVTGGAAFHVSRLCIFIGADTTYRQQRMEQGWGASVVRAAYDAIRDYGGQIQDLRHLMTDSSQGVLKMPKLTDKTVQGGKPLDAVMRRAEIFNSTKSIYRTAVIDSEEDFQYVARPLTGVADVTDRFMTAVSGATEMPQLILFGTTPGGLNASQDEQMDTYFDVVESIQEEGVTPAYNKILMCMTGGKKVTWEYRPLAQLNASKLAAIRLQEAQAIAAIQPIAALTPELVVKHLNATGHFDFEDADEQAEGLDPELELDV